MCVFVCLCVCCGTLKNEEKTVCGFKNASVCTFKTSPCMPAPRAHVSTHVRVVPVHTETFRTYTRGRFESTHGGQGFIVSSANQNLPTYMGYHGLQRFTKETFGSVLFCENRLRTTRARFLRSFALPDKAVQFQQY